MIVTLSSVGSSLLAFGAVLTSISALAGSLVAALGAAWETFLFVHAGRS